MTLAAARTGLLSRGQHSLRGVEPALPRAHDAEGLGFKGGVERRGGDQWRPRARAHLAEAVVGAGDDESGVVGVGRQHRRQRRAEMRQEAARVARQPPGHL